MVLTHRSNIPDTFLSDVPLATIPSVCNQGSPVPFINGKKHARQRPQAAREREELGGGGKPDSKKQCRAALQMELARM